MSDYNIYGETINGSLTISGVSIDELAKKYGTPFYVMDEHKIRENCREFVGAMKRNFGGNCIVSYASKAFCAKYIYKIMAEENMDCDVVSAGELYAAVSAGFDASHIHFHGNNKTPAEIRYAFECKIGSFIVDNFEELNLLDSIAAEFGAIAKVTLRIKPGVDAHTHEFVQTGKIDSKFGFAYETGEALRAAELAISLRNIDYRGIHCHIGSQILDKEPFACAADVMFALMNEIREKTNAETSELNLGGGYGISYSKTEIPQPIHEMIDYMASAIKRNAKKYNMQIPKIVIEPGRAIVGEAGATVYTVGNVKKIENVRTYVAIDGGMTDNPRYALYGSCYECTRVESCADSKTETVTIAGKCCESGDLITQDAQIQQVRAGDLICVFATGAYCYSMASNYNMLLRPPVIMANRGKEQEIVSRQTLEQLIQNNI